MQGLLHFPISQKKALKIIFFFLQGNKNIPQTKATSPQVYFLKMKHDKFPFELIFVVSPAYNITQYSISLLTCRLSGN